MDSVFGDWYEDRGEVVSRSVDGARVESKDHELVSMLRGDEVRSVDQQRWRASEGGGGLDAGRDNENCQPCLGSGVKMEGEWQRRGG